MRAANGENQNGNMTFNNYGGTNQLRRNMSARPMNQNSGLSNTFSFNPQNQNFNTYNNTPGFQQNNMTNGAFDNFNQGNYNYGNQNNSNTMQRPYSSNPNSMNNMNTMNNNMNYEVTFEPDSTADGDITYDIEVEYPDPIIPESDTYYNVDSGNALVISNPITVKTITIYTFIFFAV